LPHYDEGFVLSCKLLGLTVGNNTSEKHEHRREK